MTRKRKPSPESQPFGTHKNKKLINQDLLVTLNPLTDNQKKLFDAYDSGKNIIAHGVPGVGKAQPLYSKVLTPNGWKTIGEIQVGDEVITPNNKISKVTGVFPQGEKDIYEIVFHDGSKARACLEHLWEVHVPYSWTRKKAVPPRIENTQFIIDFLKEKDARKSDKNISIDVIEPLHTPDIELPLDPYVLGCLIGDGCLLYSRPMFSSADQEILETLQKRLDENLVLTKIKDSKYDYSIADTANRNGLNQLKKVLRGMGLYGKRSYQKEIPSIYMNAGTEQKMELLRGLLDTDGTVDKRESNQVSFSTSSEVLVHQVQELIWSIGGLCSITTKLPTYTYNGEKKVGRLSYRAWIKTRNNKELFKLTRKKDLCKDTYDALQYRRKIREVNYVGKEEAQCIMIDNEEHLYITDDYTITHNTMVLFYKALKEVLNERTPYEKVYVARSAVATRNLGFIPGTLSEKLSVFEDPYKAMVRKLFSMPNDADFAMLYGALKNQNTFEFMCTSYLRGITLENCIVIVDEFQNLSFAENFTILTRCGMNSKIMFAGDVEQSDFTRSDEKRGVLDFLKIVDIMPSFERIEFGVEDILRSPLVKEFIIAKKSLGL